MINFYWLLNSTIHLNRLKDCSLRKLLKISCQLREHRNSPRSLAIVFNLTIACWKLRRSSKVVFFVLISSKLHFYTTFFWFLIVKQLFRNSSLARLPNVKVNVFIITLISVHCFCCFFFPFMSASSTKIHFVEKAEMKNSFGFWWQEIIQN